MSQERTEKATPKKREDARRKGQIARGAELPSALSLLGALSALYLFSGNIFDQVAFNFQDTARHIAGFKQMTDTDLHAMVLGAGKFLALLTIPVILLAFTGSVAGNLAQGGFSFTGESMTQGPKRLNPISNLKRIFGPDALVNLLKSIIKLTFIVIVAYGVLAPVVSEAPSLINAPLAIVAAKLGGILFSLSFRCAVVFLVLAAGDYGYAYYKHEKSLRMTKQEIRDEYKQQEGDPMVKSQRRRAARMLTQKRSLVDVPTATVVITNPTHFAVALRYDRTKDAAPMVIAKGADNFAAKIREIARENHIPLVENPPLARGLYKLVEPKQTIPVEFFGAVAEVLAYVYRHDESSPRGNN
jgi:flagellar biosynthetic protein FlhB